MKASLLAIGTELTDGQIINSNAANISEKLKGVGVRANLHLTVADDHKMILWAIEECARHSDWIFITGGLGPTTDDFTRNVVAEWAGLELQFDPQSWEIVKSRLEARGVPVQDFQKQQCFFPKGAKILSNSRGTASAFQLEAKGKIVFVLPGPPKEIEAIWSDHLGFWLVNNTRKVDKILTRSWNTIGYGESQVAAIVDPLVKDSGLEIGYRVHFPFVEVKISYKLSELPIAQNYITKVENALSQMTVTHDNDDMAQMLVAKLEGKKSLGISDPVTGSLVLNRILKPLTKKLSQYRWSFSSDSLVQNYDVSLFLKPIDETICEVGVKQSGQIHSTRIEAPMKGANMHDRRLQYFSEMALVFWYHNVD